MPFNTRNPIPSGDLRDLDDNARNIDTWANDKTKLSHPDRFGVERYTWHGIEQKAQLDLSDAVADATAEAGQYRDQALDAKNAAQEAAMISGFSKYADTLSQLESGIGTDYIEGDVVMVFEDESRGDTSSIFKIESGAAEFKLTFDKTRQDLLSFTGNIATDAQWSDVPAHSDTAFDLQSQALANRTEWIKDSGVFFVPNVSALKDAPAPKKRTFVYLLGYYDEGDCAPWGMVWIPSSGKAENGGSVIAPNSHSGSGRWECGGDVAANPDHWGAKNPDGTLNFSRLNAAIANAPDNRLKIERFYQASSSSQIVISRENFSLEGNGRAFCGISQVETSERIGAPLFSVSAPGVQIGDMDLGGGRPVGPNEESSEEKGRNQLIFATHKVSVLRCKIHDCFRRGGTFQGVEPVLMFNEFERCGLYQTDTGPMDAAIRLDDSVAATVHYNTIRKCGQWGIAAPRANKVDIAYNKIYTPSMIGIGMNNCDSPKVYLNQVNDTFNSGIDLQQCTNQLVFGNTLINCGYGDVNYETGLRDRVYQAIYVGDDTPRSSTDTSNSVGGAIYGNIIKGGWRKGTTIPGSKQQTGCGIALVATQDMTVFGNTIEGVGLMSFYDIVVQPNKDGCGIKATNRCVGLHIYENNIKNCKLDGIALGRGIIEFLSVHDNEIDKYGRHGIAALGVLGIESLAIDDNIIGESEAVRSETIRASIYIGVGDAAIADALYLRRNKMRRRRSDSVTNNTHRIYFDVLDGGSSWTLGIHEISDNDMRNANTADMYSRIQPSVVGKARHASRVNNNRSGKYDSGSVISTFPGMWDVATEFPATAAPTAGYYGQGSKAWNAFPTYSGTAGWVCVESGSPGVWRGFGQILA